MDAFASPLERAIAAAGGASALARALGLVWPSTVTNWAVRGIPAERCLPIERATGGAVTRFELRPDIFGEAPDGAPLREAG